MRTEKELRQLAIDASEGKIFTSNDIGKYKLSDIFMKIILMSREEKEEFLKNDPVLLYEYIDERIPIEWEVYPIFTTFKHLTQEELDKLNLYINEIREKKCQC